MKQKCFWLYSDDKTIREISSEEWRKIVNSDYRRTSNTRKTCRVDNNDIYIRKGKHGIWIPRRQLEKVLE